MRLARTSPACVRILRCSLAVGWLTRSFCAMNTPQTPSRTRSPSTWGGKCARGLLELLQHAGSFKARGAFANLLTRAIPEQGVVAASGGNHGAAVAFAARRLGIPATIFVPAVSSPAKITRIRSYGAQLNVVGERYADALAASAVYAAQSGALPVHAFDQVETLLGQGTIGLELARQAPGLDTLLVPVGGGGLIAGIAAWFVGSVRVVGVEPEGAPTLTEALRAGRPVDAAAGSIAADSMAPRRVGELVFPIACRFVDRVVLVGEDAIRRAQQALWDGLRVVAEPGGAAALSALLSGVYKPDPGSGSAFSSAAATPPPWTSGPRWRASARPRKYGCIRAPMHPRSALSVRHRISGSGHSELALPDDADVVGLVLSGLPDVPHEKLAERDLQHVWILFEELVLPRRVREGNAQPGRDMVDLHLEVDDTVLVGGLAGWHGRQLDARLLEGRLHRDHEGVPRVHLGVEEVHGYPLLEFYCFTPASRCGSFRLKTRMASMRSPTARTSSPLV